MSRFWSIAGLALFAALLCPPVSAQGRDIYEVSTSDLAEIRRAFHSMGLKGADIARAADGRATLVGEFEDRDEVETAFSAARAVLGLRRVAPTTPTNIKYRLKGFDSAFASTVGKMMRKSPGAEKPAPKPAVSEPTHLPPPRTEARHGPRTYGLVVGSSKFKNLPEKHQLEFASKDAQDFYNTLVAGNKVKLDHLQLLRNEEANSNAVHAALRRLLETTEAGDTVVIFIASHGLPNALGKFDVVLYDTEFPKKKAGSKGDSLDMAVTNRASTLTDEDMGQFIVQMVLKDVRTVLVLDTCYSGKTFTEVPGFLPSRTRSLTRYKQEVAYKTAPSSESIAELAVAKDKAKEAKATRIVIVSASENEESLEMPDIGGGMFTQLYVAQLKQVNDYADAFDQTKPQVIKKARTVGFSQTPRLLVVPEDAQTKM
ncbi:MAG: caspase family protein [Betaproteobacteria bacterium]|nr:caspase family protein [Betaproteobacteria bacterium]